MRRVYLLFRQNMPGINPSDGGSIAGDIKYNNGLPELSCLFSAPEVGF